MNSPKKHNLQEIKNLAKQLLDAIEDYERDQGNGSSELDPVQARGEKIINMLRQRGHEATLSSVQVGSTITRYEITPGPGVRAESIIRLLQEGGAMSIRAQSIRPYLIPERGAIGVEVPNEKLEVVPFDDIFKSKSWQEAREKMTIPVVLGQDVDSKPVILDITKMPHALLAGSSGTGKSVCINSIVLSILCNTSPEDVRLVMVDPKVVELGVYNDAPHMLIPVITDMKRVLGALKSLIDETEKRYERFRELGVRNIDEFNKKATPLGKLPYIVCIFDEYADIMAQYTAEFETTIAYLTAKARAAGIHLILATRCSDVRNITALIKSNIPTRIAFRVTSGINSRIILDEFGAEALIGKGDMLILSPGSPELKRAQGAWVSGDEIERSVKFLAEKNGKPKYSESVTNAIERIVAATEEKDDGEAISAEGANEDTLCRMAFEVMVQNPKRASISYLQRKFSIGYGKAANIMDRLEELGYVGESLGPNKPREVLRDHWDDTITSTPKPKYVDNDDGPISAEGVNEDTLCRMAFEVMVQHPNRACISFLQRKFSIGYVKAANIMDELEKRGYVGESCGPNKPREILKSKWEG